jgi:cysteine-rich repeat protein
MDTKYRRIASLFFNLALAFLFTVPFTTSVLAATSADGFWNDIAQSRITARNQRQAVPDRYRLTELSMPAFEATLAMAPPEKSAVGVLISLPMPDGSFQDFLVENSPIMEPELAQAHPDITTYLAVADDNAAMTARLDLTPAGFHAIIFTLDGTVYIDPYQPGNRLEYISYYKQDMSRREPFYCGVTGELVDASHGLKDHLQVAAVGDVLNTYRLAVAATGEYTAFHGGTVAGGLAAIVTTINRVTGIYERELSVRLTLVANNNLVVYTNSGTDPYSNNNPGALLSENQTNLDAVIGSANYDIGHVFSTGGGGLASLGVVCNNSGKARGETGLNSPIGDVFYVDFVAHEMGHQFGGHHTFNGRTGNCAGDNRNASTAYEPGSGSTIQAYAGICGIENLQSNSDDNFHTISFDEIVSHVMGAGNCGTPSSTGNTAPTIDAGASFTVPISTPLLLTASPGVDPDNGQVLTYSWEQFDLGPAGPPNTDDGSRPIFRSFPPQLGTARFLPRMSDILNNTSTLGESLPTTNRNLTFRLTARDNAAGGGGVDHSTVVHQVTTAAGPFAVTSQNTPTAWAGGTQQTVTWDVASTTAAPVNCANVSIYFSDSGFPNFSGTTLISNTPNDGSEAITVPDSSTSTGRVMVKCNSNIFFNINNADISIPTNENCGDSVLDAGEQCDDGNSTGGDGCSESCQIENNWSCTLPQPPVAGSNALPEGSFESGTPNPAWTEASATFGTPLCNDGCGIPQGANTGSWYVWFGGIAAAETGSVEQSFTIESTDTELTFARQIAACDSADDFARLTLDGNPVWAVNGSNPACGESAYSTETIDLSSAPGGPYNNDLAHIVRFESSIFATNGGGSNFFIDDVSILRGGSPGQPSVCTFLGGSDFTIGGNVSGLAGTGLELQLNAGEILGLGADGVFTFITSLADGSAYAVTVVGQPANLSQTCSVTSDSGTLSGANIDDVTVTCVTNTYTVGGTVSGLAGTGLELQLNAGEILGIGIDGGFAFATSLADGSAYAVTVVGQPTNLSQICAVNNGSGTLDGANVTNVEVICTTDTFSVGGNVSGLAGTGLELQLNAGEILGLGADGVFTFATLLVDGRDNTVTVLTQPANLSQTCSITNDSGTLSGANIDDVTVTCVTNTYTVGGTVSGLAGTGLELQLNAGEILGLGADGVFTFATLLVDGSDFAVTVLTQPSDPEQSCQVTDGNGTLDGADVTDVIVTCVTPGEETIFADGFED